MEEIEAELAREFPGVEVLIHLDPEGQVDEPDNPLAERDETEGLRIRPHPPSRRWDLCPESSLAESLSLKSPKGEG